MRVSSVPGLGDIQYCRDDQRRGLKNKAESVGITAVRSNK
jgi:hypothetical protein